MDRDRFDKGYRPPPLTWVVHSGQSKPGELHVQFLKAFWPVAGCGLGFGDMKVIEVYELMAGIATDAPLYPDFRAGWQVSQAIDAILRSVEEERWVAVAEVGS